MAKVSLLVLLALLSLVTLSQSRVIYKKYRRIVPPKRKNVKQVEEIYEIFHTHRRPPMYGHTEEEINNFLAKDNDPRDYKPGKRPQPVPTTAIPVTTTKEPETPLTTQKAVHPDVEVSIPNWGGAGGFNGGSNWWDATTTTRRPWWDTDPETTTQGITFTTTTTQRPWWDTDPDTTTQGITFATEELETTEEATTTEAPTTTTESEYDEQEVDEDPEYEFNSRGDDEEYEDEDEEEEKEDDNEEDDNNDYDEDYEGDQPTTTEFSWWG
ncbi:uncharacterized transmembrane protein DDB_G0283675 [Phlebotomus papatasi]|uniref:uncharacterized transmembrane protein DDB_G0283675 n=1 Tax=Phlebotomus papatasi TaxID=29031 RepID=UPI0024838179|nr:uncharacterized transmembrane protein DDB_G0283675 [Phlebotomus papatasi]